MRTLLGFASLGAGLAFATYIYGPPTTWKLNAPKFDITQFEATKPEAAAAGDLVVPHPAPASRPRLQPQPDAVAGAGAARSFSPDRPLFSLAPAAATTTASIEPPAPSVPNVASTAPLVAPAASTIRVVDAPRGLKPADESSRRELVLDLQRELKRVGCYGGEVNGAWTAASQRAMGLFTERVNATLPVKEPDGILLTLVRGAKPGVCGAVCPAGQALDAEERCVPKGVLAAAGRAKAAPGRAIQPDGKASAPLHVAQGWATVTTRDPEPAVAAAETPPPVAGARATSDLPGLMTVGGPRPETDAAAAPPASIAALGTAAPTLPPQVVAPEAQRPVAGTSKKAHHDGRPRQTVTASREPSSRHGTRSVQEIFLHPLGH